eukprot:5106766-Amphidinium_carterae.1
MKEATSNNVCRQEIVAAADLELRTSKRPFWLRCHFTWRSRCNWNSLACELPPWISRLRSESHRSDASEMAAPVLKIRLIEGYSLALGTALNCTADLVSHFV